CDMVGHTGNFEAAVKAVTAVDECVKTVVEAVLKVGGSAIITGDHGNADAMTEPDGSPLTAHSTNRVPVIVVDDRFTELREDGRLSDIAPTMLEIMSLDIPAEMTGTSLIVR
ncbi:MAG TPA: 2,3-bisphosphoglycerate-independent phosphoglycerate mutase, partial [Eubacteriales bacterium]|nr:2,3-bisphosphoglycerate-independent phosphoglycerate mutase [Eubacteriales bacterium]